MVEERGAGQRLKAGNMLSQKWIIGTYEERVEKKGRGGQVEERKGSRVSGVTKLENP